MLLSVISRLETSIRNVEYGINRALTRQEILSELDKCKEILEDIQTYVEREDQTY